MRPRYDVLRPKRDQDIKLGFEAVSKQDRKVRMADTREKNYRS